MTPSRNPLVRLAVDRPTTTAMLFAAVLVMGWVATTRIPVQLFPSGYTPPWMSVVVPYEGSNPREIETAITTPIEEALATIEGVDRIGSRSTNSGAFIFIRMSGKVDMDVAYAQVTDRMERVRAKLPSDVDQVMVRKFNLEDLPAVVLAVHPKRNVADPEMYLVTESTSLEEALVKRLERVDGVARVEAQGLYGERIEIVLDQDRVNQHKVDLFALVERLRQENFSLTAGRITTDQTHVYLRSMAKIEDPARLASYPVREGLPISALGSVRRVYALGEEKSRIDLAVSADLDVFLEGEANAVETCERVKRELADAFASDRQLANFDYTILFAQGDTITESLDGLTSSAWVGGVLAVLILYIFLRRVGMTLVITFSIPLSLVVALSVLFMEGESLNLLSLMGLTISVGMLVDNSIVVVENIDRLRREAGHDHKDSARRGAGEVALAITISTLTSMVVFVPLVLMEDGEGFRFFLSRLGLPVCYALAASLVVAIVFIPFAASARVPRLEIPRAFRPVAGVLRWLDRGVGWAIEQVTRAYEALVARAVARPFDAILWLLVPAIASTFWVAARVTETDQVQEESRDFSVTVHFPDGFTLEEADDATRILETRLLEHKESLEIEHLFTHVNERRSELFATLVPADQARRSTREIQKEVEDLLPKLPGVEARLGRHWRRTAESDSSVSIVLSGPDSDRLAEYATEVERRIASLEAVTGVENEAETGFEEIRLEIDREAVLRNRLDPRAVLGTVQAALRGSRLTELSLGDRDFDLYLRIDVPSSMDREDLKTLPLPSMDGRLVPLSEVATFGDHRGFGNIRHEDGRTVLTVKADTEGEDLERLGTRIEGRLAGLVLPRGYEWKKAGRFDDWEENRSSFQFAVILAILFVFLLMGLLFESLLLPLAVLVAIPFAFTGVFWFLYLTDTPFGMMSFIGLIVLVGVVINNGIVLVDMVNRLRSEGIERDLAIRLAARHRFRPILMTAGTTILGLVPMALGTTGVAGVPYYPLGRSLIGGLAASTVFTLVLVPVFYRLLDDLGVWTRARLTRRFGRAAS